MKNSIIWGLTPYTLLKVIRRFGWTCDLHIEGWTVSQESFGCCLLDAGFLGFLLLNPEDADGMFLRNVHCPSNGLEDVVCMKIELLHKFVSFGSGIFWRIGLYLGAGTCRPTQRLLAGWRRNWDQIPCRVLRSRPAVRTIHFLYKGCRGLFIRE